MKREILLERIDKLKQIMPWYVLEYYQSFYFVGIDISINLSE